MLDRPKAQGADALTRTPDMLPVLKEAGVVDAGGAGFLLLLDALLHVLDGRPLPEPDAIEVPDEDLAKTMAHAGHDEGDHGGIADLRYEVMYFLEATDDTIPAFKDVWAGIGDSIVVVGGDGLWNCHIHTDDIGAAIEAALDCRPTPQHPGHRPARAGRGGALGARRRPPSWSASSPRPPCPPRSSPCARGTASAASSTPSACRASSRAGRP